MMEQSCQSFNQNNEGTVSQSPDDTALQQESQSLLKEIDQILNKMKELKCFQKDASFNDLINSDRQAEQLELWKKKMEDTLITIIDYDNYGPKSRKGKKIALSKKLRSVLQYQAKQPNALAFFVKTGKELAKFIKDQIEKGNRSNHMNEMKTSHNRDIYYLKLIRAFINFVSDSGPRDYKKLRSVLGKVKALKIVKGININLNKFRL